MDCIEELSKNQNEAISLYNKSVKTLGNIYFERKYSFFLSLNKKRVIVVINDIITGHIAFSVYKELMDTFLSEIRIDLL